MPILSQICIHSLVFILVRRYPNSQTRISICNSEESTAWDELKVQCTKCKNSVATKAVNLDADPIPRSILHCSFSARVRRKARDFMDYVAKSTWYQVCIPCISALPKLCCRNSPEDLVAKGDGFFV